MNVIISETIRLKNLSIGYYEKGRRKKYIAQEINASLYEGQLTCLLGANGAGKSTLLRTLSAFLPPLEGEVWLQGKRIEKYSANERARLVGVVLTEKPELHHMTVSELVGMGRSPYTNFWGNLSTTDCEAVSRALEMVGMSDFANRPADTLSDGERQKVMIAKALAQETPIIYLDEPTAFLDYPCKVETMLLLRQLAHEARKTIFLSTHDVELALQTADTLWLMKRNRMKGHGSQMNDNERGEISLSPQRKKSQLIEDTTIKPLTIGSPKELAENGALGQFFTGRDFTFDQKEMRFKIVTNYQLC